MPHWQARGPRRPRLAPGVESALVALAAAEADPAALAESARHASYKVRAAVAANPATSRETLLALATDDSFMVRASVATHLSPLGEWEPRFSTDMEPMVRRALVQRTDLAETTYRQRVRDVDLTVRKNLVKNPALPQEALRVMLGDDDYSIRAAAVATGRITAQDITWLVERDVYVAKKASQAKYAAYTAEHLLAFIAHPDKWVRCNVVDRKDCPVEVLRVLAQDTDVEVRTRVAGHANADDAILTALVLGRSEQALFAVANREDGGGGREWLVSHPDVAVRLKATRCVSVTTPALHDRLLTDRDERVRAAAISGALSTDRLFGLSHDPYPLVRKAVAAATVHGPLLADLATDPDWRVRKAVAANRRTPAPVLAELGDDPVKGVREAAAKTFLAALA